MSNLNGKKRIVVTGVGIVGPLGCGVNASVLFRRWSPETEV
ncbi:hypothetical protein [Pseudomonas petroselini]|nr:hypothetical protein [Pseudomonas petroselini]